VGSCRKRRCHGELKWWMRLFARLPRCILRNTRPSTARTNQYMCSIVEVTALSLPPPLADPPRLDWSWAMYVEGKEKPSLLMFDRSNSMSV